MATINLGKDYTVSGTVSNVSELSWDRTSEKLDVTTRSGTKHVKHTKAGLYKDVFSCTVLAEAATVFEIGQAKTLTIGPVGDTESFTCVVTSARRGEPRDGLVSYQITLTPGTASESGTTIAV